MEHCSYYLKGTNKVVRVVTDHFPLVRVFNKCMGDLSQHLWNVRSRLMDYKIEVCWVPGKQQMAADALGRNPVWHGTAENNQEGEDLGYKEACYIADDYKQEHVFEEEFEDPMLEELYDAAKEDQAYQKVVAEVKKGLTKDALKLLHSDHPARALSQQWDEIGVMERRQDGLLVFQGSRIVVPRSARKKIKDFLHIPHLGQQLTYQAAALRY